MTQEVATKPTTKAGTLHNMLTTYKAEIQAALPRHVSADRMLRMALTSARKNIALLDCTPESFIGAVIQSAQLGLEPDTPLGHAYLLPYYNSKTGKHEVNFQPGYRGYMDLVYRASNAPILDPQAVYDCDRFTYELGLHPKIDHVPMPRLPGSKLTHVYCVARFADGRTVFRVMTRDQVEAIKARSKAKGFSPWSTDYEAMALKTVIKPTVKYLPMSAELQAAVGLDDIVESGNSQDNEEWATSIKDIQTKVERIESKMEASSINTGAFDEFK